MSQFVRHIDLPDADATARLGCFFAERLQAGDVVLLEGQIGAGKTHFVRAAIRFLLARCGLDEDIPSPTFTLVQSYAAEAEIWHADLYRLTHPDEAIELGLIDAFDTAICFVEWPDRLGECRPENAVTLRFSLTQNGDARQVEISAPDMWAARLHGLEGSV